MLGSPIQDPLPRLVSQKKIPDIVSQKKILGIASQKTPLEPVVKIDFVKLLDGQTHIVLGTPADSHEHNNFICDCELDNLSNDMFADGCHPRIPCVNVMLGLRGVKFNVLLYSTFEVGSILWYKIFFCSANNVGINLYISSAGTAYLECDCRDKYNFEQHRVRVRVKYL